MVDEIYGWRIKLKDMYETSGLFLREVPISLDIPEGTVLATDITGGDVVLFETSKEIKTSDTGNGLIDSVSGSLIKYPSGEKANGCIIREFARFPTKEELEWYEKANTV